MRARLSLLVLPTAILASPLCAQGISYAWADNPSAARYSPNARYAHNASGGTVTVSRTRVGHYAVTFAGLSVRGGNVQVTAYGPGNEFCKVVSWLHRRPDLTVNVRCFTAAGRPTDTRFSVAVLDAAAASLERRPAPTPTRAIRGDTVIIGYPDGTVEKRYSGGYTRISPDGQERRVAFIQVRPPTPPVLPGEETVVTWLEGQSHNLLDIISTIVADSGMVRDYLQAEGESTGLYGRIEKRVWTLSQLVRP